MVESLATGAVVLYVAALLGLAPALLLRRRLASGAPWAPWLPPVSALLAPALAPLIPHGQEPFHAFWHALEALTHASPVGHTLAHGVGVVLAGAVAIGALRGVYVLAAAWTLAWSLRGRGTPLAPGVQLLKSDQPLSFTAGVFRPRVYVTTGLLQVLSPAELAAVLAHEQAHVRRRDGLSGGLLSLFYTLVPLPAGWSLVQDWRRRAERACDAAAARRCGAACVARALVHVASLPGRTLPSHALPFAADAEDVSARVLALLRPRETPRRRVAAGAAAVVALLLSSLWLPHFVELLTHPH